MLQRDRQRRVRAAAGVLPRTPRSTSGAWCCACVMLSISSAVLHHRRPVPVLARAAGWCRSRATRRGWTLRQVPGAADRPVGCWRGWAARRACTARCSSRRSARTTCAPRAPRAWPSRRCCSATCCATR
ncbi:MAG: hypothetical protein MZW92_72740 [Comamonadaceae bacterium]|nr:hypothetical protein [Comamonadaceae bacterium]